MMKTSELFDFQFVDRNKEQKVLNNFFQNRTEQTLWIKGNSGLGKTTFFNFVYSNWRNYCLCYVNINCDSTASDILQDFILELQKNSDIDFISMVKKKYKRLYNTVYKNSKEVTSELFPNISNIVSVILDVTYTIVTLYDNQVSPQEMIDEYIRTILTERKICICIDNFSRCNIETAELFFRFFKNFYSEENFRSCIITTSEDISEDLHYAIYHNLPCKEIKIENLDNYIYFSEILNPIFELKNFDPADIEYLFKKCNGSPKKLSTIISKLLEKNGISIYENSKAEIDRKKLFSILQSEYIQFTEDDFTSAQKWIIFSYLCLNERVKVDLLEELSLFIAKKIYLYRAYNIPKFTQELEGLIDNKILLYNSDDTISTRHDIDYRELMNIFDDSEFKPIFSQYAYEFLKYKTKISERQQLLCKLARNASIDGWEKLIFSYGKTLTKNKQYYDAQKNFAYLSNYFNKLHIMQIMFIAINSYRTGNYRLAIEQFTTISLDELQFRRAKYYYLFYIGKSYNNIGQTSRAANLLEQALEQTEIDSREYVQTLNMLHMYYFEINGKMGLSKKFFDKIKNNYKVQFPDIWANTMRGCHNFLPYSEAINVLREAENILDDELEIAYIKTTKGFLYIKNNQLCDAKNIFQEAVKTIKGLRIHEYSYAANNYAICRMLDRDYQEAKEVLQEALLWNRTEYGNIVLQVHLMMCSLHLHQQQEAQKYYNYLSDYIDKCPNADTIIKRKLYINLAIASKCLNFSIQENSFLNKCSSMIKNTSSEWRYYALTDNFDKCPISRPKSSCLTTLDFEPWFLIYAHD